MAIREGFWKNIREPDLPMPIELEYPWDGQQEFIGKLTAVESTVEYDQYMGLSMCRICGCTNGSRQFKTLEATWPQGLMHYVVEHNVMPSEEFRNYISGH